MTATGLKILVADLLAGDLTAAVPLIDALREANDPRSGDLCRLLGSLMVSLERAETASLENSRPVYICGYWHDFRAGVRCLMWVEAEYDMVKVLKARDMLAALSARGGMDRW